MCRRMHIPCNIEFKIQAYFCLNWTTFIPCQRNFWFCKSLSRFFHEFIDYYFSCVSHFTKVVLRLWDMIGIRNIIRYLFYYNCISVLFIFFSTIHAVYYIYYPVSIQCFVKYLVSCHLWIKFLRSPLNCLVIEIRYLPIKS